MKKFTFFDGKNRMKDYCLQIFTILFFYLNKYLNVINR
jgi:hypothetical protein